MAGTPTVKNEINNPSSKDHSVNGTYWVGCRFTPAAVYIAYGVSIKIGSTIPTPSTLTISLRLADGSSLPTGADLAAGSLELPDTWEADGDWVYVPFTSPVALAVDEYNAVVRCPGGAFGIYTNNSIIHSHDSGSTWSGTGSCGYKIWGCIPPTCSTAAAQNLTTRDARLLGTIDSMGDYTPVYAYFQYGLDESYGTDTAEQEKNAAVTVTQDISELISNTLYHYRFVVRYI